MEVCMNIVILGIGIIISVGYFQMWRLSQNEQKSPQTHKEMDDADKYFALYHLNKTNPVNYDGNPLNDTWGSSLIAGTDSNRHFHENQPWDLH